MQRALGIIGYHRKFIKYFASRTKDLYGAVSGKDRVENWMEARINAIKKEIIAASKQYLPDMKLSFVVETDASDIVVRAVLKQ